MYETSLKTVLGSDILTTNQLLKLVGSKTTDLDNIENSRTFCPGDKEVGIFG